MLIAVCSDVHANLGAFRAFEPSATSAGVDELWCLGDITGIGAEPVETVGAVRKVCALVISGNHDAVIAGKDSVAALGELSSPAVSSAIAAIETLESSGDLRWLRSLPSTAMRHGIECVHGSIADPLWGFVDSPEAAGQCLDRQRGPLLLVGHTHQPAAFWRTGHDAAVIAGDGMGAISLVGATAVLNPGTSGCPQRDGAPPGSWLLLDLDRQSARWHRSLVG